jgi:hypothetical protein
VHALIVLQKIDMKRFPLLVRYSFFGVVMFASNLYACEPDGVREDNVPKINSTYVVAFPVDNKTAVPGTMTFSTEGDKIFLKLVRGDLNVRMKVMIREVSDSFATGKNQYFDAVYSSEDGLLTVIVAGLIMPKGSESISGDSGGKMVIHHAASEENHFRGSTDLLPFTMALLQAEQAGTGQPATRPESKSEGGDKPQPESEGRSR